MTKPSKGLDKRRYTVTGRWTKDRVADAMRRWRDEHGDFPAHSDWTLAVIERDEDATRATRFRTSGAPSSVTVLSRFGTWEQATAVAMARDQMHSSQQRMTAKQRQAPRARLAAAVRAVAEAERAGDRIALIGALLDLAAASCEWAVRLKG